MPVSFVPKVARALEDNRPPVIWVEYQSCSGDSEAFLRANLPYKLVGAQRFYGRREIKDVIAYLRLVHNPSDEASLLRVINTPSRRIGKKTLTELRQRAAKARISSGALLLDLARGDLVDVEARRGAVDGGSAGGIG